MDTVSVIRKIEEGSAGRNPDGEIRAEIEQHLVRLFGIARTCHCGVVSPEVGSIFEVLVPMETCHTTGLGIQNGILPVGIYRLHHNEVRQGGSSHVAHLIELVSNRAVWFYCGYGNANNLWRWREMMDWRAVKKAGLPADVR